MNYVEHHFGDYARDTGHLSMTEHGAYRLLMDLYYVREKILPQNVAECCRLVRAKSSVERKAVTSVLSEFFEKTEEGWNHKRCDAEIVRMREKSQKARESAKESVRVRRETADLTNKELRAARMTSARAKGTHTKEEWHALREFCEFKCVACGADGHQDRDHIIPVYQGGSDSIDNIQPLCARCNAAKGPDRTDHRASGWSAFVQRPLGDRLAPSNQTPVTSNQTPVARKKEKTTASPTAPPDVDPQVWGDFLKLRKGKRAEVTTTALEGLRREAKLAHLSLEAALRISCERGWMGFKAEWVERPVNGSHGKQAELEQRNQQVGKEWLSRHEREPEIFDVIAEER